MTSKISFLKLMKEDIKQKSWLFFFLGVIFFVTYPAVLLIGVENRLKVTAGTSNAAALAKVWCKSVLGIGSGISQIYLMLFIGAAVLTAAAEFTYLHKKEKMDLYYSIPVRRNKLFMCGFVNGFLIFFGVFLASQILSNFIIMSKGIWEIEILKICLKALLVRSLEFLFIYTTAICAILLCGNLIVSFLGMFVFAGYGPVILLLAESYADIGFYTAYEINVGRISYSTPIGILLELEAGIGNGNPWMTELFLTLAGIILCFVADFWMSMHRQAEYGGMALAFPKLEQVIKTLLVFPGALVIGLCSYALAGTGSNFWMFAGFFFGVLVLSMIVEFIYHRDMKILFPHKLVTVGTMLAGVLFLSAILFDWIGYNSWLPQKEEIQSMSLYSMSGIGSEIYESTYLKENGMQYMEYLDNSENELLRLGSGTEDFASIYELVQEAQKETGSHGYIENRERFLVKYRLKNGKIKYRCYYIDAEVLEKAEAQLYQEKWYKEICYPILSDDKKYKIENLVEVHMDIGDEEEFVIWSEADDIRKIYQIYREELREQSSENIKMWKENRDYYEGSKFVFVFSEKMEGSNKTRLFYEYGYPLEDGFEKTLKKIKELKE